MPPVKRARLRLPFPLLLTALLSAMGGGLVAILPSSAFTPGHIPARSEHPRKHVREGGRTGPRSSSHPRMLVRRGLAGPAGPQGPAGPAGPTGPAGPAAPQDAHSLQIDWRGLEDASGNDSSSIDLSGIGTLTVTCDEEEQTLSVEPEAASARTVLDTTVFQGEGTEGVSSNERSYSESKAPISLALPPNGMVTATISVEPIAGHGGEQLAAPAILTLSSEYKLNGASESEDDCHVAAQVIQRQ